MSKTAGPARTWKGWIASLLLLMLGYRGDVVVSIIPALQIAQTALKAPFTSKGLAKEKMGKKSKRASRKRGGKKKQMPMTTLTRAANARAHSTKRLVHLLVATASNKENNSNTERGFDDGTAAIRKEHKELCPEAQDYYPVTQDLFDREIWKEIQQYWLDPSTKSRITKETAWKLLKGLRLESLKSLPIQDGAETMPSVEDAHELELLFSMPFQFMEKELRQDVPERICEYWSIRWYNLIPGYNQTLFGSVILLPFFEDPPTSLG